MSRNFNLRLLSRAAACALGGAVFLAAPLAHATPVTFTGSGLSTQNHNISATAVFSIVTENGHDDLEIVLTNTSTGNPGYHNPDLLAGISFDTTDGAATLTPDLTLGANALELTSGSSMVGTLAAGTSLGDHWEYRYSSTGFNNGSLDTTDTNLIGAAGFSPLLGYGNFGSNSQNVNGLDYSIVGDDWNTAKANTGTKNQEPFEEDSITIFLSGLPANFVDPSIQIKNVLFLYGTSPESVLASTVKMPEPESIAIFAVGLGGIAAWRRRRKA